MRGMPIDRVTQTDPHLFRVSETRDQEERKRNQDQGQKERDKFEKRPPLWKRILTRDNRVASNLLLMRKPPPSSQGKVQEEEEEEKSGKTLTERFLVLWGILDRHGTPRPGVIVTYILIVGVMLGGLFLMIGMTLWR